MAVGRITRIGKNIALNRAYKDIPDYTPPKYIAIGSGGSVTAVEGDTNLNTIEFLDKYNNVDSKLYKVLDSVVINESERSVTIQVTLNALEGTDVDINELGVFNDDATKKLTSRDTHDIITKNDNQEVRITMVNEIV